MTKNILYRFIAKATAYIEQIHYRKFLSRKYVNLIRPHSLLFYYGNIHSQRGQDGILSELFRRLSINKGVFVEFGAWDGMYLSNCRYLYEKGWSGVYIEANAKRYEKLCNIYFEDTDIVTINSMIGSPKYGLGDLNLAQLLTNNGVKIEDITFVSIDVDGPDLEIFSDLGFAPPVILLEGGFNFSPYFEQSIPNEIAWKNMQQPLPVILKRAQEVGYKPVCYYQDTYLVRCDLAAPFESAYDDAINLYKDAFYFMPNDYREGLLEMRSASKVIRNFEHKYFGHFCADPLEYSKFQ